MSDDADLDSNLRRCLMTSTMVVVTQPRTRITATMTPIRMTTTVSPPPASRLNHTATPSSHYAQYPSSYPMDLYNFPPAHSMTQPPNYSSHYMSGSNFFRPPSLSSANTMSEYETYNEKYQVC